MATADRNDAAMDALDRYLNGLAAGTVTSPSTPTGDRDLPAELRETVGQLAGRDDADAPDPTFVERLENELMDTALSAAEAIAQIPIRYRPDALEMPPSPVTLPNRPGSDRERTSTHPLPSRRRRLWPALNVAAAILLLGLFTTVVGLLAVRQAGDQGLPALVGLWQNEDDPVPASVPMARGNPARTGHHPGPGPAGEPAIRWRFDAEALGYKVPNRTAVVDGVAYVAVGDFLDGRGALYAFDAASGEERWHTEVDELVLSSPAVVDGAVYFATIRGRLYALDAATGAEQWQTELDAGVDGSSPVVADGVVYIQSGGFGSSPAVVDGVVYVGGGLPENDIISDGAVLHAVDAASGEQRWSLPTPDQGLYAVDAATGTARWHYQTPESTMSFAMPAVADGVAFVGVRDALAQVGRVVAVDIATGEERWRAELPYTWATSPAVADGVVYVSSFVNLHAFDAETGTERWQAEDLSADPELGLYEPTVADGVVYVSGGDRVVHAVDAATGETRWEFPVAGEVAGSPTVIDGLVYVGTGTDRDPDGDGALYALGDPGAGTPAATPAATPAT